MNEEKKHIFDNPANVKRVVRTLVALCAGLFAFDFFYHRHTEISPEKIPGFYALYGFVACVILVLAAKEMRKLLMRKEDYYEGDDDE